jgi:hypothetical protein
MEEIYTSVRAIRNAHKILAGKLEARHHLVYPVIEGTTILKRILEAEWEGRDQNQPAQDRVQRCDLMNTAVNRGGSCTDSRA